MLTLLASMALLVLQQEGWEKLAPLPDKEGFASPFAGVMDGKLVVAGGANFPDKKPWEGGIKVWHDSIFMLDHPGADWKNAGKLPKPLAYGVSVTLKDGMLCIGGSDPKKHYADCFLVGLDNNQLKFKVYPSLPKPCANMCGMKIGDMVYLAGGTEAPDSLKALHNFWCLNLNDVKAGWKVLEPWPGLGRMLPVCAGDGENFYLFSGAALSLNATGKIERTYLSDAFVFKPKVGWKKLPTMPRPCIAASSPAIFSKGVIQLLSGDDGKLVNFEPKQKHPGFPKASMVFDPQTNSWGKDLPFHLSRATVPLVSWKGSIILISGEVRPGIRTPEIWSMRLP
jgi:N-acetylneuraminate epimerase